MVVEQVGEIVLGSGDRCSRKGVVKFLENQSVALLRHQFQLRSGQRVFPAYFGEQCRNLPGAEV